MNCKKTKECQKNMNYKDQKYKKINNKLNKFKKMDNQINKINKQRIKKIY